MKSPPAETLIEIFRFNNNSIHQTVKDVTQAESLFQPPFKGNCMNWVIGHILNERDMILHFLGLPAVLTEAETALYKGGSERLTDPSKAVDLQSLVERLDVSLEKMTSRLGSMTPEELDAMVPLRRGPDHLGGFIAFLQWHEAYHTGQLDLLREISGKNNKGA